MISLTGTARAQELSAPNVDRGPDPTSESPAQPGVDTYFVRASAGFGGHQGSEHRSLLKADGYELGTRKWLSADFGIAVSEPLFLGAWISHAWSSAEPKHQGPTLRERDLMAGAQAPIVLSGRHLALIAAPRVGVTATTLDLYEQGEPAYGPVLGLSLGLVLQPVPLSISVAYDYAPTQPPGEIGRGYDAGGLRLMISGALYDAHTN
jgi:hypothetical protein